MEVCLVLENELELDPFTAQASALEVETVAEDDLTGSYAGHAAELVVAAAEELLLEVSGQS